MNGSKIKILLVEDNPGDVILLVDVLNKFGNGEFEISQAADLDLAIKRLQMEKLDAVVLDLSLPLFFGLEPLERVRRMKPKIPIVVLSGYNDPELAAEAMKKGAKNYFVKNRIDGESLVKTLLSAVGRAAPAQPGEPAGHS